VDPITIAILAPLIIAVIAGTVVGWRGFLQPVGTPGPQHYVFVEDDGTVRELTAAEREYLGREYDPTDGARPYVKRRYWSRTPDGKMHGFMYRFDVPGYIRILKTP
jgi:hypothetical protein